jgi:hypothetical protein
VVSQSGGGRLGVWPGEHRTLPPLLPVAWPLRLLYSPDVMRHHPHLPVQLGTLFWQRLGGSQGSVTGGILVSTVRLPPPSPTLLWAAACRYTIFLTEFFGVLFLGDPTAGRSHDVVFGRVRSVAGPRLYNRLPRPRGYISVVAFHTHASCRQSAPWRLVVGGLRDVGGWVGSPVRRTRATQTGSRI